MLFDPKSPSRTHFDTQQEICYPAGNVGYLYVFRTKILGGVRGVGWLVGWLVGWFVGLLVCWFVGLLVCWFVGLLVCLFVC